MTGGGPERANRLRFGDGSISGFLSFFLAALCLAAVVCFHFPEYVTTPEFRALYPLDLLRAVLRTCLVASFVFALTSFALGGRRRLAFYAVLVGAAAILAGGSTVEVDDFDQGRLYLSLDWLILDLLVLAVIFVPIEALFPKRAQQSRFHPEWRTDLVYFVIGHLFVQVTALLVRSPAELLFARAGLGALQQVVQALPFLPQLLLALLLADVFQYGVHRAFHAVPWLWRFHSVHHSIRAVDWLAGSRLHLIDIVVTRAFAYIPLYVCGFDAAVFNTYVVIVSFQAVAAHANTRIPTRWLEHVIVTPRYHHWHHSDDPAAYDKNLAIHFPWIDRLFGTHHLPGDDWPDSLGLGDQPFPKGYLRQFLHPFRGGAAEPAPGDPPLL